ncbi:hypothetical protein HG536_0F03930 [Torulaspora globosa]|uniref:Guanine nucleotide exchange factor LTE1 n=1 Tax=Torulaspora globosa TaxID=48254 RepID=A0A7G3ZKN2_9SACH|nr:uncharacterized protein HG536_0F03930 [Torulaspora globosa]QLL34068.1 hypothetical protein HG536_0F03930 [Torulaspora globosa]
MKQMDCFNKPEYYPVPSETVISYARGDGNSGGRKQVLKADLLALIVFLTSPEDAVDYTAISDFFLIYRNFISPMELSDLLILRLRWCMSESSSPNGERRKIGKITLVRTFVLLRHWILNYYVQNFLPDVNLRLRVIKFLNEPCESYPSIVKSIIVNLKKAWVRCSRRVWTNLALDEPASVGQDDRWALYEIKDYTQLEELRKRGSRLSTYAKNGSSSPNFRNQSVLSLFKESDVFKIPDSVGATSRTASMVLFPCDNSNVKTGFCLEGEDKFGNEQNNAKATHSEHKRMVSNLSKMTNVSGMLRDVKESVSPNLDQLIPPTPAKKVELILKLPEDIGSDSEGKEIKRNGGKVPAVENSSIEKHRGPMALLSKWKNNHSRTAKLRAGAASSVSNSFAKPEMDNFVKYVISITSLETKAQELEDPQSLVSSKFDILSARTIEEVEFLVSLENDLISQVRGSVEPHADAPANDLVKIDDEESVETQGFSAVDNLNLYQTVSSIANSVVSLSNNLNRPSKVPNGAVSPSSAALERRKVQSSMAAILRSNSKFSFVSRNNSMKESSNEPTDGPQRLVFHDSESVDRGKGDNETSSEAAPQLTMLKKRYSQSPTRTSPLRNNLPSLAEDHLTSSMHGGMTRGSSYSSITYDSDLSMSSRASPGDRHIENDNQSINALKRKGARNNLREFTFESQKRKSMQDIESASSFVTTRESIDGATPLSQKPPDKVARPASGRISIMRKPTIAKSPLRSIQQSQKEDLDFLLRDKELMQNELEVALLQKKTASITASVDTGVLFVSQNNSPKKLPQQEALCIRLSTTPSIQSITDKSPVLVRTTMDNTEGSSETQDPNEGLKNELHRLNLQTSADSSLGYPEFEESVSLSDAAKSSGLKNKYLFSPDNDSVDIASPAKNVEELKDKFLNKDEKEDTSESPSQTDATSTNGLADDAEKLIAEFKNKAMQEENILNIVSLPDDSVHDDPVNVALMKLEGTYKKGSDDKSGSEQESRSSSVLAEEVDMLGIADLSVPQIDPSDRRRSLLIEKRRQTIMNIPFTPDTEKDAERVNEKSLRMDAKQLLQGYQLKDPSLLIANNDLHVSFILMYDSLSIAQQMTLIERELLSEIDWNELLNLKLAGSAPRATSWLQLLVQNESLSGINLAIARFNLMVDWIVSEIVLTADVKLKRNTIQRFIHVAEHCRLFQNYNTMMEIVLALGSTTVQKFSEAWRLIEPGDLITWEELKVIPSLDRNYSTIRKLLNDVDPLKGCVPFIVLYLSDISLNSEKKSWFVENQVVNYNKFDTNVQMVKNFIQRVQWSRYYDFPVNHELLSKCVYLTALTQEEITQLTR